MKKQTLYRIAVSVLFLLFGSLTAFAQSQEHLMTVQVPFDFQVGEKLLPAGSYIIRRDPQMPNFLLLQCPDHKISMIVSTLPHSLPEQSSLGSLIFKDYGEKHFLSEVKVSKNSVMYSVVKSKAERRLAQTTDAKPLRAGPNDARANN